MSAHTPGPWFAGAAQWHRGSGPYKVPISGGGKTIANVLTWQDWRESGMNTEANARLIAAAPELLEFAKWAMGQFCGDSGTGESHWEQFEEFRKGQSAIAKAESES